MRELGRRDGAPSRGAAARSLGAAALLTAALGTATATPGCARRAEAAATAGSSASAPRPAARRTSPPRPVASSGAGRQRAARDSAAEAPAAAAARAAPTAPATGDLDPTCADNRCLAPDAGADLERKAALLVDALVGGPPAPAETSFVPLAPFVALKAARAPARYHALLVEAFRRDLAALAGARPPGGPARVTHVHATAPEWVPPGREQNRIGYYRARPVLVRYSVGAAERELLVGTAITWNGRWYVTHLR